MQDIHVLPFFMLESTVAMRRIASYVCVYVCNFAYIYTEYNVSLHIYNIHTRIFICIHGGVGGRVTSGQSYSYGWSKQTLIHVITYCAMLLI